MFYKKKMEGLGALRARQSHELTGTFSVNFTVKYLK